MRIITNHHARPIVYGCELTPAERESFDYLTPDELDQAWFVRYCGSTYDLGEFTADYGMVRGSGLPDRLAGWDGYMSESAFTAVLVRYCEGHESVVMAWCLS